MKAQLSREEARVRELERTVDDYITEKKALLGEIETKKMENNFLEDECRMLRDMVEDFRLRVKGLEGGVGEKIIRDVREADDYSSEDGSAVDSTLDVSVLLELSSLGSEIQRTGTVSAPEDSSKSVDGGVSQDIFDRLTNPSNFTGTQKNIFEKDVESNRAKVQQIKEGALAHRRRKDDGKHALLQSSEDGEEIEGNSLREASRVEVISQCDDATNGVESHSSSEKRSRDGRGSGAEKHASDKPNVATASGSHGRQLTPPSTGNLRDQENVFSRLLNPSKYTGIHRRKQHLPDSPGSPNSHVTSSAMDDRSNSGSSRNSRRLRSRSIDRTNEPDRRVNKASSDREKDSSRRKSPGNTT